MTHWDDTAAVYKTKNYKKLKTAKVFLKNVHVGDKILDVGCATGGFYGAVRHVGIIYTGIDITPNSIQAAKTMHPEVNFIVGDIKNLPFHENCFDIVVCWDVLVHVDNYKRALNELHRTTRKKLIFTCQLTKEKEYLAGKQGAAPYNIFNMDDFLVLLESLFPSVELTCGYGYMLPDVDVPAKYVKNLNAIIIADKTRTAPTKIKIRNKFLTLAKSKLHQAWLGARGRI